MVKLYSKEQTFCGQCKTTKFALNKQGTEYEVIDLESDPEALAFVQSLGYQQAPVVFVSADDHWSGFQPARVAQLAAA